MDKHSEKFKVRLGLFIAVGLLLFALAVFFIGQQKNLFNPVFVLNTTFSNVSGLQVGNNVRYLGINVGTITDIKIANDSSVMVQMQIRKEIQQHIKADSKAQIGSEGLIGDRLLIITPGTDSNTVVAKRQVVSSTEPIETDEIIASLAITAGNAEIISEELSEIIININQGEGTLGRLINDESIAENLNQTIKNLKSSSKGLDENMEAAKSNFLLKGYFNKKEKAAQKKKDDLAKKLKKEKEQKEKDAKKAIEAKEKKDN